MTKKKLLLAANLMSFYSILARDEVQAGNFKTSLQRDKILKYLSRINRLSEKIGSVLMEDKR
jgi:hypothetical protein